MHWFWCPMCSPRIGLVKCANKHCKGEVDHPTVIVCPECRGQFMATPYLKSGVAKEGI